MPLLIRTVIVAGVYFLHSCEGMIVPRFSVTQSETLLVIKIHVPYIRVSDAEIFAENNEFTFYCKPYNLKLAFQGEISSDETCRAKYDPDEDNGVIIAELPKLIPGTYFPGLDLPSRLLLDRKTADSSKYQFPTIEVVGESNNLNEDQQIDELSESFATSANLLRPHYGFNLKYCDILRHQRDEILTIFTIANPDDIPVHRRRALRNDHEILSFDADRYLGDFLEGSDDPIHVESLAYTSFWEEMWQKKKELTSQSNENQNESDEDVVFGLIGFADDEKESMRRLPNRTFLIPKGGIEERSICLSLLDILFAYCYDHRTTQGEPTVESAYTITMLSPTLSSFESYLNYTSAVDTDPSSTHDDPLPLSTLSVREVMIESARRCLIYPYLRTWKLVKKVFVDVTKILFLGQRCVLKCLLQIYRIFEKTDNYYLLNKLFIDDYCVWLQFLRSNSTMSLLTELAKEYNSAKGSISKSEMYGLNIEKIESSLEEAEVEHSEAIPLPIPPLSNPLDFAAPPVVGQSDEPISRSSRPLIEVVSSTQFAEEEPSESTE